MFLSSTIFWVLFSSPLSFEGLEGLLDPGWLGVELETLLVFLFSLTAKTIGGGGLWLGLKVD
ncbi:MAG: hypothetical protein MRERC_2c140 [Mycoplasmataceae bacterium RC_NB112A]|nr:MAG: hypothetical protein MRERC_2c140 [Mycoplasmataceae bacterium RC_NB112A]